MPSEVACSVLTAERNRLSPGFADCGECMVHCYTEEIAL